MSLIEDDDVVEALATDGPDDGFDVGIRIGRARRGEEHADTRLLQSASHITAPLPISIADQHLRRVDDTIVGHRQCADDLLHEQRLGMRRGSEDLHAAGGQIDDEDRCST